MRYGRMYSVSFSEVAVTAVQDLFNILFGANDVGVFHRLTLSQSSEEGDVQDEQLYISIRRVTGAPTDGTGGATPTAQKFQDGDAAAGTTNRTNDAATQLSGGTNVILHSEAWNIRNGYDLYPAPEDRWIFQPSTRLLVELEEAPADSVTMSGTLWFEEIG